MLDSQPREGATHAVEIATPCMRGKRGVHAGTHAPQAVRVLDVDVKRLGSLPVHGFADVAHLIEAATSGG